MKIKSFIAILISSILFFSCSEEENYLDNSTNNGDNIDQPEVEPIPIVDGNLYDIPLDGAVDLGLSVKWASCDIGSQRPYIAGTPMSRDDSHSYNKNGYRTPTEQDVDELWADCKWELCNFHNVVGFVVTGPSGKSIFLTEDDRWCNWSDIYSRFRVSDSNNKINLNKLSDFVYYSEKRIMRPVCE